MPCCSPPPPHPHTHPPGSPVASSLEMGPLIAHAGRARTRTFLPTLPEGSTRVGLHKGGGGEATVQSEASSTARGHTPLQSGSPNHIKVPYCSPGPHMDL